VIVTNTGVLGGTGTISRAELHVAGTAASGTFLALPAFNAGVTHPPGGGLVVVLAPSSLALLPFRP
jgi:hypothetical protein